MPNIKADFIRFLIIAGLITVTDMVWQALELLFHGQVTPSLEDTIMGMILSLSLYYNLRIKIRQFDWGRNDDQN